MPNCRQIKDTCNYESVCTYIKTRSAIVALILGLIAISGAFIYIAHYITSQNWNTDQIPAQLSYALKRLESRNWCLESSSSLNLPVSSDDTNVTRWYESRSACLQLVVVIPGDYYPTLRNQSIYKGHIDSSSLFTAVHQSQMLEIEFLLQHNSSTSTRYSRDVLVPSFVRLSGQKHDLPNYILDASSCKMSSPVSFSVVTPCNKESPRFHVDQRWNIDLDVYVSMSDWSKMNLHLMFTTYFVLITAATVIAYSLYKSRYSSSKYKSQKIPI